MKLARGEWIFLFVCWALMAAACLPWMPILGMEYDEAHFLETATRIAATHPEKLRPPDGFYLFHRPFPFMSMLYVGALDGWLLALPIALFGYSPMVPRVTHLLAGCVVIGLAYGLARRLGGVRAGMLAAACLLVDIEFLLHVPTHFGPFLLQMAAATLAYWLVDRWLACGRPRDFYWACFVAGLGFQEKLTFVWVLAVLVLAILIFRWREVWQRLTVKLFAVGFALFLLGALPVLWYVIAKREEVFGYGGASTAAPGFDRVAERFRQFHNLLGGQVFMIQQLGTVGVERWSALPVLFWGGVIAAIVWRVRAAAPLLFFAAALVLLNALFPEGGRLHHLMLAYPLMQAGAGVALARARWTIVIAGVLLAATAVSTAHNLVWYTEEVRRTGGRGHWSAAIYDLAAWMRTQPDKRYVSASWGFLRPLYFLTEGKTSIHDRYFDLLPEPMPPDNRAEVAKLVKRRGTYWMTSDIQPQFVENRRKLFAIAAEFGLSPRLVRTLYEPAGEPIYWVYTFLGEDLASWTPSAIRRDGALEVQFPVGPDTRDVRFHLSARKWHRATALTVEFLDQRGERLSGWWRSIKHYAITPLEETMSFGPDLYPDYFVPLPEAREGAPAKVRAIVDSSGPVDLVLTDVGER